MFRTSLFSIISHVKVFGVSFWKACISQNLYTVKHSFWVCTFIRCLRTMLRQKNAENFIFELKWHHICLKLKSPNWEKFPAKISIFGIFDRRRGIQYTVYCTRYLYNTGITYTCITCTATVIQTITDCFWRAKIFKFSSRKISNQNLNSDQPPTRHKRRLVGPLSLRRSGSNQCRGSLGLTVWVYIVGPPKLHLWL